jgi:hypothetical protein
MVELTEKMASLVASVRLVGDKPFPLVMVLVSRDAIAVAGEFVEALDEANKTADLAKLSAALQVELTKRAEALLAGRPLADQAAKIAIAAVVPQAVAALGKYSGRVEQLKATLRPIISSGVIVLTELEQALVS